MFSRIGIRGQGILCHHNEKLTWDDVLPAAKKAFCIWVGQPELKWAKKAWRHVAKAGLNNYNNELEYYMACVRLLTLADIYYDWCAIAWDEDHTYEEILWASEEFDFEPFRLGQLIGPEELVEESLSSSELTRGAIGILISRTRPDLVEALISGHKRTTALFASLYNSRATDKGSVIKESEIDSVDLHYSDAWEWLENGCPSWRLDSCNALIP